MIRFEPDTLLDALVRPIGMAVPAGGIYVETIAPDFRFVFVLALLLAWLAWRVRARAAAARTLGLLAFVAASFVPWLATSGNGRYFMVSLLVVGPLCIALLHHLPVQQGARLGLAGLMVAAQVFLLHEVQPWNSWGLAPWRAGPAFEVQVPEDLRRQPATYVTLSNISYSLIAPSFHPQSRWISLSSVPTQPADAPDLRRATKLLEASPVIHALFPSLENVLGDKAPLAEQSDAIDLALVDHGLQLRRSECRLLPSQGLTHVGAQPGQALEEMAPRGFWVCGTARVDAASAPAKPQPSPDMEAVLDRVERMCPRLFPPGTARSHMLSVGLRRFYSESDMRLYLLNDGKVVYKYMRALNSVVLGGKDEVMASGFRMDCNIRGRAGLPWEREI